MSYFVWPIYYSNIFIRYLGPPHLFSQNQKMKLINFIQTLRNKDKNINITEDEVKKTLPKHEGPKAFSALTQSTTLFHSRSFNNL